MKRDEVDEASSVRTETVKTKGGVVRMPLKSDEALLLRAA